MNENEKPQPPVPDPTATTDPDEHPTRALDDATAAQPYAAGDQPAGYPSEAGASRPDAAQPVPGQAGPAQPAPAQPGAFPPAGGYAQTSGAYQGPAGYPNPGGYAPPPGGYAPPAGSYSPPPGGYPPPTGYAQPAYPGPTPTAPSGARRLTRSRNDRLIGGVCGGLARYWNTDATLLRILTVVLTLVTGGALLVGYLIAWVVIPDEPTGATNPFGQPADTVGYASGGNPGYADMSGGYEPPAPRERSYLGWLILSLAVLAAGALGLVGFLVPASVGIWGVILGVALAILGIGLLIGTKYGRARWLLWLAIPLAFITVGTVQASNFVRDNPNWERWTASSGEDGWGGLTIGDRTWQVEAADAADGTPLEYQLSAGSAVLDLTELSTLEAGAGRTADRTDPVIIDAGVGVGELIVLVPLDMQLDLTAKVNLGQIKVPGSSMSDGSDLEMRTTIDPVAGAEPAYTVTLDAAIGAGSLEVRREAA